MSWSTSGAGKSGDVAAKMEKDLAVASYDSPQHGALKVSIAAVARAIAACVPDATIAFKTYRPAP